MAYSGYFSQPGYAPRTSTAPAFQAPSLPPFQAARPTGPVAERGLRPHIQVQEKDLLNRMSTIGSRFQPRRTMQIGQTRAALKGYGGYQVKDDGSIDYAQGSQPGQFYKDAFRTNRDAANARGILDSSFAAKAIGAAFGRLTAEQQSIVTQHAGAMNQLVAEEASMYDELNTTLLQLYGSEAEYLINNPPPPPEEKPVSGSPTPGGGAAASRRWTGSNPPDKAYLARVWGVDVSQIGVGRTNDGKYVAAIKKA